MRYLLIVVLVVVGVVGYYRGWFVVSTDNGPGQDQSTASFTVNKKKIQNDVNEFAEKTKEQVDSITHGRTPARHSVTEATARGQIETVGQGKLTVRTPEDQILTFGVVPKTVVQVGDRPATMADLRKDDPVSVVYTDDEEQ